MTWDWSPDQRRDLGRYLADRGLCGPDVSTQVVGDGHSNLTYLVSDGQRRVVVRRPPPPPVPAGAHDVLREAKVVGALAGAPVPVPRVLAAATAGEIIDVPVVVTEFIDAAVITERTPDPLDQPAFRREIGLSVIDTLASLHAVDWRAIGLADFGRPSGFNARHLRRVCGLVADRDGAVPAEFSDLAEWLQRSVPPEAGASLVHNDFRIGNLMVGSSARVVAVLDWELATIGDPLFDLGYFLSSYPQHGEPLTPVSRMGTAVLEAGYPTRGELLDRYCDRTPYDVTALNWYSALAQFKLAALYQYGRRRASEGGGDPYFADSRLVRSFLDAAEEHACGG